MVVNRHPEGNEPGALRCRHCGEAIGVYEPLIYMDSEGQTVRSSLLRLPGDARDPSNGMVLFHASCHSAAAVE